MPTNTVLVGVEGQSFFKVIETAENGCLSLLALAEHYPGTTGLKYKEGGDWKEALCLEGELQPPDGRWGTKEYMCIRDGIYKPPVVLKKRAVIVNKSNNIVLGQGPPPADRSSKTAPSVLLDNNCAPGEESWQNIIAFERLNMSQKMFDWSKKVAPKLGMPQTSSVLTEFYPLWPTPRFEQLYGNYSLMVETDGIDRLLNRSNTKSRGRRGRDRSARARSRSKTHRRRSRSRSSRGARSRSRSRRGGRSRSRSSRGARSRSRSRRGGRSRSRTKRHGRSRSRSPIMIRSPELEPPGLEEIQVVLENRTEEPRRSTRERSRDKIGDLRDNLDRKRKNKEREDMDRKLRHKEYERKRRRDESSERRERDRKRNYEERRKYEEMRKSIREERLMLERELQNKKEQSRWMQKSDDFLKRLGIAPTDESQSDYPEPEALSSRRRSRSREERSGRYSEERSHYSDRRSGSRYRDFPEQPSRVTRSPSYNDPGSPDIQEISFGRTLDDQTPVRFQENNAPDVYSYSHRREGSTSSSRLSAGTTSYIEDSQPSRDPRSQYAPSATIDLSPEYSRFSESIIRQGEVRSSQSQDQTDNLLSLSSNFRNAVNPRASTSITQGGGADIDLRGGGSRQNSEVLRPGNYLLVVYDMITLGAGIKADPYQIGAISTLGDTFLRCIEPKNQKYEAEVSRELPMVMFKNKFHLNNRTTGTMEPCHLEEIAFKDFISFLEKCKNRTRPAYDGIVLVSESEESIPLLLKFVKRMNLETWFWRNVVSLGGLSNYVTRALKQDARIKRYIARNKDVASIPLGHLYNELFLTKINTTGIFSDLKANYVYQVLLKALEINPDYSNYFKDYTHPRGSKNIVNLIRPTSYAERLELFTPLRAFVTKTLRAQREDMLDDEDEVAHDQPSPEESAHQMCNSLIDAGFDFDELLEMANSRGLSNMELNLRTILMQKMAGQSRSVVSSAIQTTKLVVGFFLQNGHKTLEQLLDEAELIPSTTKYSKPTSNPECSGKELEEYESLRKFIFGKVFTSNALAEKSIRTQSCIDVLLEEDMTLERLRSLYDSLRKDEVKLHSELKKRIEKTYHRIGPPGLNFTNFVGFMAEFLDRSPVLSARSPPIDEAPAFQASTNSNVPAWYRCRNCRVARRHWYAQCGHNNRTVEDETYINNFLRTFPKQDPSVLQSLRHLKHHLEKVFRPPSSYSSHNTPQNRQLCHLAAQSVIQGMASLNIPGRLLLECKTMSDDIANSRLYAKFKNGKAFPTFIDLEAVKKIIKEYVSVV